MYHHYFGPDYYSFTRGGVHFVGLNTVDIDDQHYYGHVDSLQLAWLERDLALVPADDAGRHVRPHPVLHDVRATERLRRRAAGAVADHRRTARRRIRHTVSNAGDVLAVLRKRRHVLALGGHMHATERIEYEMAGVHDALQSDLGRRRQTARRRAAIHRPA